MCILPTKKYAKKNSREVSGFKTILVERGKIFTSYLHHPLIAGKWNTDTASGLVPRTSYETGFHIFADQKIAENWAETEPRGTRVVPCKGRDVRAAGEQWGGKAYVCKQIFLSKKDVKAAPIKSKIQSLLRKYR